MPVYTVSLTRSIEGECEEDVLALDMTLTPRQVEDVLGMIERKHDCTLGVTWETIEYWIERIKEESEENAS